MTASSAPQTPCGDSPLRGIGRPVQQVVRRWVVMSSASPLIVSVSGVRGIVGESLTPQVALAFASAYAAHLGGGVVVISRDGRPSGMMVRYAVQAGLVAGGCEIQDLGVAATPTVGLA